MSLKIDDAEVTHEPDTDPVDPHIPSWLSRAAPRLTRKQRKAARRAALLEDRPLPNADRVAADYPPPELYSARLHDMLSLARPHDTDAEADFVQRFIMPYTPIAISNYGWLIQVVNESGSCPRVLFSSHVDTVHRTAGGLQKIWYCPDKQEYFKKDGQPLGADDSAGIWLMLEMIDARVPGCYTFWRGEERGGIGSFDASQDPTWSKFFKNFDMMVAFDRRGYGDVITHQGGSRCCSDEFASELAASINMRDLSMMYTPDDSGIFTDSANFTEIIPECTNISVGYDSEHTGYEAQNLPHLFALRDALINVDWTELPIKRDPAAVEKALRWGKWDVGFKSAFDLPYDVPAVKSKRGAYYEALDGFEMPFCQLSKDEMEELCYNDPNYFVSLVRTELGLD